MNISSSADTVNTRFWALLIGINRYLSDTLNTLEGCLNDVEAMRVLLMNRYNVPDDHIRILKDEQATRANILREFQNFLIENPDIAPGDQILLHYSGHGSQMIAKIEDAEPDGHNETIVPYDSRTEQVYDIPDKTIAALLEGLRSRKGDNITVIFDSCHSGGATRKVNQPGAPGVRRAPADWRLPPTDLDADIQARLPGRTRSAGPSGWAVSDGGYVLLAGCRDREESNEYAETLDDQPQDKHGALTFFTLQVLRQLSEGASYAELHERMAPLVSAQFPTQNPQCEGSRGRMIFGGLRVQQDPFIVVRQVQGQTVTLGAGLVHGLRPGTQLAVYPAEVRTRADLPPQPLATVEVTSVGAISAQAQVQGNAAAAIPVLARALITRQVYAGMRQTVLLEAGSQSGDQPAQEALRRAILHATADDRESPYLQLVDADAPVVNLRVQTAGGRFTIYQGRSDEVLVEPEDFQKASIAQSAQNVRHALESIARFRTLAALTNDNASSELNGKIRLQVKRFESGPNGPTWKDLPEGAVGSGGELTLLYDSEQQDRNLYVVEVTNASTQKVYIHVFVMSPDYSINRLYPNLNQEEAVLPNQGGAPFRIGLREPKERLEVYLPEGWDASRDMIKLIAATAPADLKLLEQEGLRVPPPPGGTRSGTTNPLEQLVDAVAFGHRTRHVRPSAIQAGEDWTTSELRISTVRADRPVALPAGTAQVSLGDGIRLEKPAGFQGQVTVTTVGQATRGAEADPGLKLPPGLAQFPDQFQPLRRDISVRRSAGSTALVLDLDVDEASRSLITPEQPLRIRVPEQAADGAGDWLAVAFDGQDYLITGYGSVDPTGIDVVCLPSPAGESAGPTKRGLARTIKLFLYKKMGRHTDLIGLHRAELQDGQVRYEPVRLEQFTSGQKVALFIHGFTSDTRWMIQGPAQFLRREVLPYDHLLTWDYETFGTSVEDNGAALAQALRQQCGFGPNDEMTLDVYSHSMGTLVTRCLVELSSGHEFVDRAILAGPPNRGTTLASTGRGLIYLATRLLNYASLVPPLGAINWTVKELYDQGVAVADIAVDAPVLQRLNALEQPSNVPYLVLAGENVLDPQEQASIDRLARKMLDQGLDSIYGEQNDLAIGLSSMRGLRGGAYPNLTLETLSCDHFQYYQSAQGQAAIKRWMVG